MEKELSTAGVLPVAHANPPSVIRKNTVCRHCGSSRLVKFLSLGDQPPSNSFLHADQIPNEKRYPLDAYWCEDCCLVQLLDVVPAQSIFNEYLYASSSSKALKAHYARLAETMVHRLNLHEGDVVVDIGCNDGILLGGYALPGLVRVGVEPSQLAETAQRAGFDVIRSFFDHAAVSEILRKHGTAKVVTATNVFAHVDEIGKFVEHLPTLLGSEGVFVVESPYMIDMIDQVLFDTIYHEHLSYWSLTPMVPFLAHYGLDVYDVERIQFGASGPAIRVYVRNRRTQAEAMPSVKQMLQMEEAWGIRAVGRYTNYAQKVESVKSSVLRLLDPLRKSHSRLAGYGAPAKGNTLLNYFGLTGEDLACIAETNALKQGYLTPGSHIPIVSEEEFLERKPDYALLLAWNYLDYFLEKSAYILQGGRFIVPLPNPRMAP